MDRVTCPSCQREKDIDEFYVLGKNKKICYCKVCYRNKLKIRRRVEKEKVIQEYGGKCVCCGEDRKEFLSIDHKEHKVYCFNCNTAKHIYGMCPHEWKFTLTKEEFADLMSQLAPILG